MGLKMKMFFLKGTHCKAVTACLHTTQVNFRQREKSRIKNAEKFGGENFFNDPQSQ
jgi:hypothetical protein